MCMHNMYLHLGLSIELADAGTIPTRPVLNADTTAITAMSDDDEPRPWQGPHEMVPIAQFNIWFGHDVDWDCDCLHFNPFRPGGGPHITTCVPGCISTRATRVASATERTA